MEKIYDLHQHKYCVVIYISKTKVFANILSTSSRFISDPGKIFSVDTCIIYNKQRTDVIDWGILNSEENDDCIIIDNFNDGLYNIFKKKDRNEQDYFFMDAISKFLDLFIQEITEIFGPSIESFDDLFYTLIVPSHWEEEMRNELLVSIFIQADLISKDDRNDRLLFVSDLESIVYQFKDKKKEYSFKRRENTIVCTIIPTENNRETLIKLDLIQTTNPLFDFSNSMLFPKLKNSATITLSEEYIETCVKYFLKKELFPHSNDHFQVIDCISKSILEDLGDSSEEYSNVDLAEQYDLEKFGVSHNILTRRCAYNLKSWKLNKSQQTFIKSIRISDICREISESLFESTQGILFNNSAKEYAMVILYDVYSTTIHNNSFVVDWVRYMLRYTALSLKVTKINETAPKIKTRDILMGAGNAAFETIHNSDIYCHPRIVSLEDLSTSSAVFFNSKPKSIINIDISINATLLSYSLLNNDGTIETTFNHKYIIRDRCLPPLSSFYEIFKVINLNVKKQFISFADNYLNNDNISLTEIESILSKELSIPKSPVPTKRRTYIKTSLRKYKSYLKNSVLGRDQPTKESSPQDTLINIQQKKYFNMFLLMYLIYINQLISSSLPIGLNSNNMDMKTGYTISIEKILLNNIIGTKGSLKDMIYTSGLISKNDHSKKLRLITQQDMSLPLILKHWNLVFPLKSYFVFAQLYEDYIQLDLNQVVIMPNLDERQTSIIIEEKIITIQNIYDSLSSVMWNNLVQNTELIQLCQSHEGINDIDKLELFLLETKAEFITCIKNYILNNIFNINKNSQPIKKETIQFTSCSCSYCFTTNDIITISFKPVLKELTSIISASLINKDIFGNYTEISYLFNLIQFNHNPQYQNILTLLLKNKMYSFNEEQGIQTECMIIPTLPNKIIHPLLYKEFQTGAINQVYSESYAISIDYEASDSAYAKLIDPERIESNTHTLLPITKKGDIINNVQINKLIYIKTIQGYYRKQIKIAIHKLKNIDDLELQENNHEIIYSNTVYFKPIDFKSHNKVPILVSVVSQGYSSSLKISLKLLDRNINTNYFMEVGEPMTLDRF